MSIRKLNLVMTYPVKWGEWEVMYNFVQNFYDALGRDRFRDRFDASYDNGTIVMRSDNGFSKEWLMYIGASTKRDGDHEYAGKFGEGFKVASLVALRDMGIGVCMESRDWKLTVIEAVDEIDGRPVKVLAYNIEERPYAEDAVLTLSGASQKHYDQLFSQINMFYYEENGRFGRCIAKGDGYAVYTAKRSPNETRTWGGVFINLQFRVSLSIPIYFCLHSYPVPGDDRERDELPYMILKSAIRKVISYLKPFEALEVLEIYKARWLDHFSRSGEYNFDWEAVFSDLIDIICSDEAALSAFQKKHSAGLVAESYWQFYSKHKKKMAYEWFRHSEYSKRRRVYQEFRRLGISDIYTLCLDNGGFEEETLPDESQLERIRILETIAEEYFGSIICYDRLPECRLIQNVRSPLAGKAECRKTELKRYNHIGLRVVSDIHTVYILEKYLEEESLCAVLPVYMHELLHQYGGDSSVQFRKALLRMNEIIIAYRKEILEFDKKWKQTF